MNEIKIMKKITDVKNPIFIDLYEVHETKNSVYLIMELLEGGVIFNIGLLNKSIIEDKTKVHYILLSLLVYLKELHSLGIMHRDLKPDNILFANNFSSLATCATNLDNFDSGSELISSRNQKSDYDNFDINPIKVIDYG